MIYGYVRVSTNHQNVENQRHEIELFAQNCHFAIDKWCVEVISSRKALKIRKLSKLLKKLKKGDILITTEISRLGRNILEIMTILQTCLEEDCQVWTLKEQYKLGADIQSKVLAFAFSLTSEIERQLISQRTKNALQRLKDEGFKLGRPLSLQHQNLIRNHNEIKKMLDSDMSKTEIAQTMGCSWTMIHRYVLANFSQN